MNPRPAPNVLIVSRQRLVGRTNGSSVYLLELAQALRDAGMRVHLLQPSPSLMGRLPILKLKPEMRVFETHVARGLVKVGDVLVSPDPRVYAAAAWGVLTRLARKAGMKGAWTQDRPMPYSIALPWTPADHAYVRRAAAGKADLVIADYMFQAEAFSDLPKVATGVVMHDLFHAREGASDSVATVAREDEIAMLAKADVVIAIQPHEGAFITEHVPDTEALVAPMAAHPVAAIQPGDDDRLLFVGSNTAPNVVGLQWLFDEVWPMIAAGRPHARLDVAGTVARAFPAGGPEGVRFLGPVDDLDALYAQAGVVLSPLTFGSGLKIKLIEAMAKGKAIVATTVTMQGVEADCEGAVAVTDDPAAFAGHVLRLQADAEGRRDLAQAALDVARARFSPEACYRPLVDWAKAAARRR